MRLLCGSQNASYLRKNKIHLGQHQFLSSVQDVDHCNHSVDCLMSVLSTIRCLQDHRPSVANEQACRSRSDFCVKKELCTFLLKEVIWDLHRDALRTASLRMTCDFAYHPAQWHRLKWGGACCMNMNQRLWYTGRCSKGTRVADAIQGKRSIDSDAPLQVQM